MSEDMELQLWEYIDGDCTETERKRVAGLIATNAAWAKAYRELKALQADIHTHLQPELTTDITQGIMQALPRPEANKPAPSKKIIALTWCIRAIAAFYIIALGVCLINILQGIELTTGGIDIMPDLSWGDYVPNATLSKEAQLLYIAYILIIACVIFTDKLLRKKLKAHFLLT